MWLLQQPSAAARTALIYITLGSLTVIWTGVWLLYLHNNPPETSGVYYVCGGCLVTGLTLIAIGLGLGQIGRSARHADMPPEPVVPTVTSTAPVAATPVAATPVAAVPVAPPTVVAPANAPAVATPAPPQQVAPPVQPAAPARFSAGNERR